jgi:anti-sigma factor RsiW
MSEDDAKLVALIDGELDEAHKSSLLSRMATDGGLRARYERLRDAGSPIGASFEALLDQAPVARLRALLPPEEPKAKAPARFSGFALRQLAAAFVLGLLLAGAAVWAALSFGLIGGDSDDWRTAVSNYMELYTRETFVPFNPTAETQARDLAAVGARVGVPLTPDRVELPGLHFKAALNLAYEGSPLGEIAYVDDAGKPTLFCVIANGAPDAPARESRRGGYRLVDWSRGGRGFLVIGNMPKERATELAEMLEKRI